MLRDDEWDSEQNDGQFEGYLREFRPRRPGVLPTVAPSRTRQQLAIAACAALVIGAVWLGLKSEFGTRVGLAITTATPHPPTNDLPAQVSAVRAVSLSLENPKEFDASLDEVSRRVLPDVEWSGGALYKLGRQ